MAADRDEDVQALLARIRNGDEEAKNRLISLLYNDLLQRAGRIAGVEASKSLSPSRVVQDALLRYLAADALPVTDRAHFLNAMTKAMRQVVIDYWRKKGAGKRKAEGERVPLDELIDVLGASEASADDRLEKLAGCLEDLEAIDKHAFDAIRYRYFEQLSEEEVAEQLRRGLSTVQRDLRNGKTYLRTCLEEEDE
jgi:RNA polymerase sigma factor (TIGR02999 family)